MNAQASIPLFAQAFQNKLGSCKDPEVYKALSMTFANLLSSSDSSDAPTVKKAKAIAFKSCFKDLKDLQGKTFAFVDPASMSGYILPLKYLNDLGVKLGDTKFAMKHDNVVSMIYQGQVDAGATFYSPPEEKDGIQDARRLVKAQYPDVEDKIEILKLTSDIPNDPIVFAKEMPEEMKLTIVAALLKFVETPEGKTAFKNISGVDSLTAGNDKNYDGIREMIKAAKANPEEILSKKK